MKRFHVVLLSCLVVAGSAWLGHVVWGQGTDSKEKTFTITKTQLDKYVADQVAQAMAGRKDAPASDEQVLKPENWHKAIYNNAEYVIYTGPGQFQFHHWVQSAKPVVPKGGAPKSSAAAAPPAASF
jgi:hypothetical protein